jgi:cell division protein FtsQ
LSRKSSSSDLTKKRRVSGGQTGSFRSTQSGPIKAVRTRDGDWQDPSGAPKRHPGRRIDTMATTGRIPAVPEPKTAPHEGRSRRDASGSGSGRASTRPDRPAEPARVHHSRRWILIAAIILVVVLAAAAVSLYLSPLFSIKEVQIQGAGREPVAELLKLADVPTGATLLRVDTTQIAQNLKSDIWISSVQVQRHFPDTLVIAVTERAPFAVAELVDPTAKNGLNPWLLSADGVWLGSALDLSKLGATVQNSEVTGLVQIQGLTAAVEGQIGQVAGDPQMKAAIAVLSGLGSDFESTVASVDVTNATDIDLKLRTNVEIDFGDASDIPDKVKAIQALQDAHPNAITYMNVRTPAKSTYRALK